MDRPSASVEELVSDHRAVEAALKVLSQAVERAKRTGSVDIGLLREVCVFSQSFVDRCHHGKEEGCFFPCLEKRGMPREGGPIAVMLEEHDMGRKLVARIAAALDGFASGSAQASEVTDLCQEYHALLSQHVLKEEGVLFPMGSSIMEGSDDAETRACFDSKKDSLGAEELDRLLSLMFGLSGQG